MGAGKNHNKVGLLSEQTTLITIKTFVSILIQKRHRVQMRSHQYRPGERTRRWLQGDDRTMSKGTDSLQNRGKNKRGDTENNQRRNSQVSGKKMPLHNKHPVLQ